jgi:hypothetical protein
MCFNREKLKIKGEQMKKTYAIIAALMIVLLALTGCDFGGGGGGQTDNPWEDQYNVVLEGNITSDMTIH